ncbi:unnamed protein product [Porites evermanni]|uniref:Uncharacterized protein n=1 Tax=Porites evermanni TaxID=104178 RepID=A0ABN8M226_9CNID|nr:unnamed protein product [Porites evermanni]
MYTEIRRCMAVDFPDDFGPEVLTEPTKSLKEMMKEKIRNVRQDFCAAINKGTRSGSGKIVQENFELLSEIWGGSPASTSLSFGIDADLLGTDKSLEMDVESPEDSPNTAIEGQTKETFEPSTDQKPKGVAVSNIPKLVDNKRRHMEKTLSQAQRDQLLMNTAKEELLMKSEMVKSFEQ